MKLKYISYLLRAWQTSEIQGTASWVFTLEDPHTRQIKRFQDLDALMKFIRQTIKSQAEKGQDHEEKGVG